MTGSINPIKRHRDRCREVRGQMSEYLDAELDPDVARALERHLRWCPDCRRMLASLKSTIGGLRALSGRLADVGDMRSPDAEQQR